MKKILIPCLLSIVFIGIACSSSYKLLKTKQEPTFRLNNYRTFGFYEVEAKGDTVPARFEENLEVIKQAIADNLKTRGLTQSETPDLKINLGITVKEKIQTRQTDFRTDGYPRYMGQRRYSWKSEDVEVGRYKEGTMFIDLVDAKDNKQVWQRGVEGTISKNGNMKEGLNKMIAQIVTEIP